LLLAETRFFELSPSSRSTHLYGYLSVQPGYSFTLLIPWTATNK